MRAALKNTPKKLCQPGDVPLLVPVHERRRRRTNIRACTDEKEDHEQQRLKVEERRLTFSALHVPWRGVGGG